MLDGINGGVITADRLEVHHLRDFSNEVGTGSPLLSVKKR